MLALIVDHAQREREDYADYLAQRGNNTVEAGDGMHGMTKAGTLLRDVSRRICSTRSAACSLPQNRLFDEVSCRPRSIRIIPSIRNCSVRALVNML